MAQRSPYPDVDIPEIPIHAFVLERASELGDKPAIIDGPTGCGMRRCGRHRPDPRRS
jgi:hypothetical protein